jgi:hypothetical protein
VPKHVAKLIKCVYVLHIKFRTIKDYYFPKCYSPICLAIESHCVLCAVGIKLFIYIYIYIYNVDLFSSSKCWRILVFGYYCQILNHYFLYKSTEINIHKGVWPGLMYECV